MYHSPCQLQFDEGVLCNDERGKKMEAAMHSCTAPFEPHQHFRLSVLLRCSLVAHKPIHTRWISDLETMDMTSTATKLIHEKEKDAIKSLRRGFKNCNNMISIMLWRGGDLNAATICLQSCFKFYRWPNSTLLTAQIISKRKKNSLQNKKMPNKYSKMETQTGRHAGFAVATVEQTNQKIRKQSIR